MSEIKTDRLLMRPFTEADREHFISLKTTHKNMASTKVGVLDEQAADALLLDYVAHWQAGRPGMWALFHRDCGTFIGECGFAARPGFDEPTLRYTIDHQWWGQKLAPEAVRAVLDHGFKNYLLEHVSALALESNHRSCRLLEASGMNVIENNFEGVSGFRRYTLGRP